MSGSTERADVQTRLLRTIGDERAVRDDVAELYALALRTPGRYAWAEINAAILRRWSKSGLEYIKKAAWS